MTHISTQPIRIIVDPTASAVYYVVMNDFFHTLSEKIKIAGVGLIVFAVFYIVIKLIETFAPYSLIPLGAGLWYVWYVAECAINGGQTAGTAPFKYMVDDFKNNFGPIRSQLAHRMKLSNGDREWAGMYPGKLHAILTHICLPLTPITVWWIMQWTNIN